MVQVTVGWGGEFQGSEANVIQSLVIDTVGLVSVLNELVDGQGGVVGLDDGIRYLEQEMNRQQLDQNTEKCIQR